MQMVKFYLGKIIFNYVSLKNESKETIIINYLRFKFYLVSFSVFMKLVPTLDIFNSYLLDAEIIYSDVKYPASKKLLKLFSPIPGIEVRLTLLLENFLSCIFKMHKMSKNLLFLE